MEKYLQRIMDTLTEAAGDEALSMEDYAALCATVSDEAWACHDATLNELTYDDKGVDADDEHTIPF